MRDINRIDGFLEEIKAIWKKFPDLRFGQLVNNAVTEPMLYYIEDDKMINEIKKFYDTTGAGEKEKGGGK